VEDGYKLTLLFVVVIIYVYTITPFLVSAFNWDLGGEGEYQYINLPLSHFPPFSPPPLLPNRTSKVFLHIDKMYELLWFFETFRICISVFRRKTTFGLDFRDESLERGDSHLQSLVQGLSGPRHYF
jgi:hypothetical protein